MRRLPVHVRPLFPAWLELRRPIAADPARDCCARSFARGPGGRLRVLECIRAKHDLEEPCNPWPVSPDPRSLTCPECGSGPGEPCSSHPRELEEPHAARLLLWSEDGTREEPRDFACPTCAAAEGAACRSPGGDPCKSHGARLELAARTGVWLEPGPTRDIRGPECHTTPGEDLELEDLELPARLVLAGACPCGGGFLEPFTVGSRPDLLERAGRGEHVATTHCDRCREPLPLFLELPAEGAA